MHKLRKLSLSVHRYVGIVAGLILCVVAIAGSLLVFEAELDRPTESAFTTDIFLDFARYSGKLLKLEDTRKANLVDRILKAQYTLHVGQYGGVVTKLIYALVGIAPLGLFVTGFLIWWSRTYAVKLSDRTILSRK